MTDIVLTHSYFLQFDRKQQAAGQPYPPLATLYVASALRSKGFGVALHDTMFADDAAEIKPVLEINRPRFFIICDDGFNYLTKMCLTNMREAAMKMIALAKQQGCKVIVSSSDSTDHAEMYLEHGADFIVAGEAEQTMCELLAALNENKAVHDIDGLIYRDNETLNRTGRRENLRDLDQLSFPAWDLIDMEPYRKSWQKSKGFFSLNMTTTRGCPYKCNWCAKPIYGNRYNSRSPRNVVDELKLMKQQFSFDHIWFCDDIFGLKPGWVKDFATLAKEEGLSFRFKIQSRVDLLLEEDQIGYLAAAGCEEVWVGAESGSQKILDAMDKGTKIAQIERATLLMKEKGIRPCFFLQFGYPGEEKEDIQATLRMVQKLMPHDIGISVSYPLPGTKFYDKVKAELKEKKNWTDSDELLVMFNSTYAPVYYKKLQRFVHYRFRQWQNEAYFLQSPWSKRFHPKKFATLCYYYLRIAAGRFQLKKYAG